MSLGGKIKAAMLGRGYPWFPDQNVVSVEGMDPDGTPNANRHNAFDDIKMVLDGDGQIIGGPWAATTQPGAYWTEHPMAEGGAFIIALGPQSCWTPGDYHGLTVWRQAEDSSILGHRDPEQTFKRQGAPVKHGNIGVHHHGGYNLPKDNISNAAAGCQVIEMTAEQAAFMHLTMQCPRYLADKEGYRMTATVLEAKDLAEAGPAPDISLSGKGKGSWYSQYNGKYEWHDSGDAPGSNALGVPDSAQGIAFYDHDTLGHWFMVEAPNGKVSIEQQTDIGPAPRTGRLIDISAAAAERFGYSPHSFPTDSVFQWQPIEPPPAVAALKLKQQATAFRDLRGQAPVPAPTPAPEEPPVPDPVLPSPPPPHSGLSAEEKAQLVAALVPLVVATVSQALKLPKTASFFSSLLPALFGATPQLAILAYAALAIAQAVAETGATLPSLVTVLPTLLGSAGAAGTVSKLNKLLAAKQ